jgi:hypothetical protein
MQAPLSRPLRTPRKALVALTLMAGLLSACGEKAVSGQAALEQGITKLSASDYSGAVASLKQAAAALASDPTQASFKQAHVALAQAQAHVDAKKAFADFAEFIGNHEALVQPDDVLRVANALSDLPSGVTSAASLVKLYVTEHAEQAATFAPIDKKINDKIAAGDVSDEDRKFLEGMGYLGG